MSDIVQSAVKLGKSIVQFVVKTGVVCALIHDRKKFHGRGTLLLLVKNDAELLKMKTTCTSDKMKIHLLFEELKKTELILISIKS